MKIGIVELSATVFGWAWLFHDPNVICLATAWELKGIQYHVIYTVN